MQKRNLRRALVAGAIAAAAVSITAHAHGDRNRGDGEERGQRMSEKFARKLDLNDSQKAQVEEIFAEFFAQHRSRRDETRERLAALWNRPQLTASDIEAAMDETKRRREETRALAARQIAALHGVLTPAQRERAIEEFGLDHFGAMLAGGRFSGHRRGWGKHHGEGGDWGIGRHIRHHFGWGKHHGEGRDRGERRHRDDDDDDDY